MSSAPLPAPPVSTVLAPVAISAPLTSACFVCLDPAIADSLWEALQKDLAVAAQVLDLTHFLTRSLNASPYGGEGAATAGHLHYLHVVCHRAKLQFKRWPQFLLAVVPNYATAITAQYFGVIQARLAASTGTNFLPLSQHGIAVQCVQASLLVNAPPERRVHHLADAYYRLNAKLGGCNSLPRAPPAGALGHTLILGGAISHVGGGPEGAWHSGIVACLDFNRARWWTETRIQLGKPRTIDQLGNMLDQVLDGFGEPVNRVLYVRASVPPYNLETVLDYERKRIQHTLCARIGSLPALAIVVPWSEDHDASSAEDYNTFSIHSQTFAVPFNEFGSGWDLDALRRLVASLTYNFAYDNSPTVFPAPLTYATAVAESVQFHYERGAPSKPTRTIVDYKHIPRSSSRIPHWL